MDKSVPGAQSTTCAPPSANPAHELAAVGAVSLAQPETALVWRGDRGRFFTKLAAERDIAKAAIQAFNRATGEDGMEADVYNELVGYLLPFVQRGEPVTFEVIDGYFNPHHYPETPARAPGTSGLVVGKQAVQGAGQSNGTPPSPTTDQPQ